MQNTQRPLKLKEPDMPVPSQVVLSLTMSIACVTAVQNSAYSEEYRGTFEQQMACTPDVFRLCGQQIPDVNRIVACLRQNTPQLSGACRAVFESNDSVPDQAAPKRRNDQPKPSSIQ